MDGKRKIVGRILLPMATSAAIVGVVSATPAFASNDWTGGSIHAAHVRNADSSIYGGRAFVTIAWSGYNVDIDGFAKDTAGDDRSAVMEIRYQVYYGGTWHTHYRYPVTASGKGHQRNAGPYRNRYPTRNVVARICLKHKGKVVTCDPHWR
jgi:hypothetical protein